MALMIPVPIMRCYRFDGLLIDFPLGFPGISRVGANPKTNLKALSLELIERLSDQAESLLQHCLSAPEIAWIPFELNAHHLAFKQLIPACTWSALDGSQYQAVPPLEWVVKLGKKEDAFQAVQRELPAFIAAQKPETVSEWLLRLAQIEKVEIAILNLELHPKSPVQRLREEEAPEKVDVLAECARRVTAQHKHFFGLEDKTRQLADVLAGNPPRSVLLVGPSGVGKSALFENLAQNAGVFGLAAVPFWQTSGSELVSGMSGFGMWQERCLALVHQAARDKIILHLGSLKELVQVGQYEGQDQGIASFLRPFILRGGLLVVCECQSEEIAAIERHDPQLVSTFEILHVEEPRPEVIHEIFHKAVDRYAPHLRLEEARYQTVLDLHRRFAPYSAMPGRALRFFIRMLETQPEACQTDAGIQGQFALETGLPSFLVVDTEPLDPHQAEAFFKASVLAQDAAIQKVISVLLLTKAKLTRKGKPLGSLLLIGPTGVGKTECAKALSRFLFKSEERLTRLDMSEFGDADAVFRLVGGQGREGLLIKKVREEPFCVLLLDEFEKAHPAVFDLLLQILGDARLSDGAGKLADFTNCFLLMTSNLGAETFQRGRLAPITSDLAIDAERHFQQEVQKTLRPEIFNRIDAIVPFLPLDAEQIQRLAQRTLDQLAHSEPLALRDCHITWAPEAEQALARSGYSPKYGARALRRTFFQRVGVGLAQLLNLSGKKHGTLVLDGNLSWRWQGELAAPHVPIGTGSLLNLKTLRRKVVALQRSNAYMDLRNEWYRATRRLKKGKTIDDPKIKPVGKILTQTEALLSDCQGLESTWELNYLEGLEMVGPEQVLPLKARFRELSLQCLAFESDYPHAVTLSIFSESPPLIEALVLDYALVARHFGWTTETTLFQIGTNPHEPDPSFWQTYTRDRNICRVSVPDPIQHLPITLMTFGASFYFSGSYCGLYLQEESGVNLFIRAAGSEKALLLVTQDSQGKMVPPEGFERKGKIPSGKPSREWHMEARSFISTKDGSSRSWGRGSKHMVLVEFLEQQLDRRLEGMLK
ncbi:MAG: ATP-dependent Clp protease ATP-binding subunit [Acidobacteria bacterium]|nr:ATP-dependent Clp protease ATP-binding subunit [Acidobacteriota bacterium]MCB9396812.1 ATP-dependent Clp protease ATP-binding subunit [Acidobacteriota bacterium]